MNKLGRWLNKLMQWGAIASLTAMIVVVLIQIVARFTPGISAPSWTEELARLLFVYSIAFGVGIGIRENAFVKLDLIDQWLPPKLQRILQALIHVGVFLFAGFISIFAFIFVINGTSETSPSMGINMSIAFFSVFVMTLSIAGYTLEQFVQSFKSGREH